MKKLFNSDIVGETIGKWRASKTPDGCIIWSRPSRTFFVTKEHPVVIFATPHLDEENVVSVDVCRLSPQLNMEGDISLSTAFKLPGVRMFKDKVEYLKNMKQIIYLLN